MSIPKIYVGNIPFSADETILDNLFNVFGTIIELKLIKDHETGRSKGFAFITFEEQDQADNALELNGTDVDGRTIKVNRANANNNGGRRSGSNRGNYGGGNRDRGGNW